MIRRGPAPQGIARDAFSTEEEYQRARRLKNQRARRRMHLSEVAAWKKSNDVKVRSYRKTTQQRRRDQVLALFGNVCAHCGFTDPRALQLDHINGATEPRGHPLRHGSQLYKAVLDGTKSRDEFQVLCANCNWIKRHVNGECTGRKRSTVALPPSA